MKICHFAGDIRQMNKTKSEGKYCALWLHIEIPPSAKLHEEMLRPKGETDLCGLELEGRFSERIWARFWPWVLSR